MEPARAVLAAKFWNEDVESTRSLDACVHSVPCGPPAVGLLRGSKLTRSQQLLLFQRLWNVPFTPSVESPNDSNKNCGGLVLDRVLTSIGGSKWWTTITGRARAQRFWLLEKQSRGRRSDTNLFSSSDNEHLFQGEDQKWWQGGKLLLDPSLYALSTRSRFELGSHTFLNVSSEVDSVNALFRTESDTSEPGSRGPQSPWHGRFSLHRNAEAHNWILESTYHGRFVDREAQYWEVPHVTTLDLASVGLKGGGLRYRVGLHHSSGNAVACPNAESTILGEVPLGARPGVRAQAAVSLEKEKFLWKKKIARHPVKSSYNLLAARPGLSVSGIAGGLLTARIGSLWSSLKRTTHADEGELHHLPPSWRSSFAVGEGCGPVSADLFASLGISAQLGLSQRLVLDHTKFGVQMDVGAVSGLWAATRHVPPIATGSQALYRRLDNGFFTVALSLQQQLVGSLCARTDSRFVIDPANARNWQPRLQEVTYGFDCSLEKLGASKLVIWYSPTKCEGMVELRILER